MEVWWFAVCKKKFNLQRRALQLVKYVLEVWQVAVYTQQE